MRERGTVFVVTLAILASLVAIVASVAQTEHIALKQQGYSADEARARTAAEAGIQRAVEALADASASGTTANTASGSTQGSNVNQPGATTLQDNWATLGTTGNDNFQLKDSSFRLQILDACSRVNLNTATATQLQTLPLLQEQIDAITDWRSAGEVASSDGAKDDYYNALQNPYDAALQPFSTVSELLDVRYFTPADLYDTPANQPLAGTQLPDFADGRTPVLSELLTVDSQARAVNAQGNTKSSLRSASNGTLSQQLGYGIRPSNAVNRLLNSIKSSATWSALIGNFPTMTATQLRTLLNNYYVGTSSTLTGKININTAPAAVLMTIPGITQDEANTIVNQQTTGYTTLGSILTIPGLTSVRSVRSVLDSLTINSNTFIVRVIGKAGKATVPLEAVLRVSTVPTGQTANVTILRMEEQPFDDMTGRWGWQTTTNNDIPLEASS